MIGFAAGLLLFSLEWGVPIAFGGVAVAFIVKDSSVADNTEKSQPKDGPCGKQLCHFLKVIHDVEPSRGVEGGLCLERRELTAGNRESNAPGTQPSS